MISVLIPAYNEAERIGATLAAVQTLAASDLANAVGVKTSVKGGVEVIEIIEVIVVDDGSADDTAARAEAAGADVVFRQANQGKGAALRQAFALSKGDIALLLDADLGASAGEADKLLRPLITGQADMTVATFPILPGKGGGMGLVVRLARWGIRRLTGRTMTAPLSGQRALRRDVIDTVGGFADGWGVEIGLTVNALRAGFRVLEVPTGMTHRVTGRDMAGVRHRATQFVAALRVLARLAFAPRPARPVAPALPPETK